MLLRFGEERSILAKKANFAISNYRRETELENQVEKHSKTVFGPYSVYLHIRQKLSTPYASRFCDGLLLDLSDLFYPRFWVVEFELSTHDLYRSIEPQLRGFVRALKSEEMLSMIRSLVYEELRASSTDRRNVLKCL